MNFTIKIEGDSEGFVTFSCPFCRSDFKLSISEFDSEENDISEFFCPYCGLANSVDAFYTDEVMEQAQAVATNYVIEEMNKAFKSMGKSVNKGKGLIKVKTTPMKPLPTHDIKELDTNETVFKCSLCSQSVKVLYCAGKSKIFCPYCGVDL